MSETGHAARITSSQHLPVLDGIRAIAVLLVIGWHFVLNFDPSPFTFAYGLATWGQTGVDLFFVLSGFLITGILLDTKGTLHFLRNFYARRILRIFPLYYSTLAVCFLVLPALGLSGESWKQSGWYWIYLHNIVRTFSPEYRAGPSHFWSLAVEEHYYFVWPWLVMALDRRKLLGVIGAAIGVSLLTRVLMAHYDPIFFTPARLDGLAIGSALAIFARDVPRGLARWVPPARLVVLAMAPVLLVIELSRIGGQITHGLKATLVSFVFAAFLVLVLERKCGRVADRALSGRALGSIGKYSYAMYVFHPFLISGLRRAGMPYGVGTLLVAVVLTYVAGWISWVVLERRCLRLKRYFDSRVPGPPAQAVVL